MRVVTDAYCAIAIYLICKLTLRKFLGSIFRGDWTDKALFPTTRIHSHDIHVGSRSKCVCA